MKTKQEVKSEAIQKNLITKHIDTKITTKRMNGELASALGCSRLWSLCASLTRTNDGNNDTRRVRNCEEEDAKSQNVLSILRKEPAGKGAAGEKKSSGLQCDYVYQIIGAETG